MTGDCVRNTFPGPPSRSRPSALAGESSAHLRQVCACLQVVHEPLAYPRALGLIHSLIHWPQTFVKHLLQVQAEFWQPGTWRRIRLRPPIILTLLFRAESSMISLQLLPVLDEENTAQRGQMPQISRALRSKSSGLPIILTLSRESTQVEDPKYIMFNDP